MNCENWNGKLFEHLAEFPNILVTGPHRAGTTFATRCIANDTGHHCAVEEKIKFDCRFLMDLHLRDDRQFVIQCPFLAPIIHEYPGTLVVWVMRPRADVMASRGRMYGRRGFKVRPEPMVARMLQRYHARGDLYAIQHENWGVQKTRLPNWLEIQYQDLKAHPLFVEHRDDFHVRQTELGQEIERKPPLDLIPTVEINDTSSFST